MGKGQRAKGKAERPSAVDQIHTLTVMPQGGKFKDQKGGLQINSKNKPNAAFCNKSLIKTFKKLTICNIHIVL